MSSPSHPVSPLVPPTPTSPRHSAALSDMNNSSLQSFSHDHPVAANVEQNIDEVNSIPLPSSPSSSVLIQMPPVTTTKTRTVTTTTTTVTTTAYPPLIFQPPPRNIMYDHKNYPLANSKTPDILKSFTVSFDGLKVHCNEEEDGKLQATASQEESAPADQSTLWSASLPSVSIPFSMEQHLYYQQRKRKRSMGSTGSNSDLSSTADLFAARGSSSRRPSEKLPSVDVSMLPRKMDAPILPSIPPHKKRAVKGTDGNPPPAEPISPFLTQSHGSDDQLPPSPVRSPSDPLSGDDEDMIDATGAELLALSGNQSSSKNTSPFKDISPLVTLTQLPRFLSVYDTLPQSLQSYLLLQLLRRSSIGTLQVVSSVVNPALKRDFLGLLPFEIGVHILDLLDYKSLCRVARVCKRWRALADGDGRLWRMRGALDGFWDYDGKGSAVKVQNPTDIHQIQKAKMLAGIPSDNIDEQIDQKIAASLSTMNIPKSNPALPPSTPHPYKHLYRRIHVMRNNWMNGRSKNLTFSGHEHNVVTCLQFDDEKIVSGSDDQSIRIYDIRTGDLIRVLEGHAGGVWALQYVGNTLVSGSTDRTVRIWDMSTGRCTHVFHGHTSTVRCLQIIEPSPVPSSSLSMNRKTGYAVSSTYLAPPVKNSPSFPIIVTGSRDATLRVWKLPNPEKDSPYLASEHSDESGSSNPYFIRTLSGHGHSVRALAGHGNIVCSGSYDCTVRVWDIAQGECLWRLTGHSQKVYSIVYDGVSKCWSGSMDASVRCWDVTTGQCLAVLDGHASLVGLLELTPKHLISAAADASLRIWSTEDNSLQSTLQAHNGAITCFQFDNYKVISGSEGHIKLWDLKSGKVVRDLVSGVNGVWRLRCDERWLVSAVQRNGRTEFVVMDFDVGEDEALAADGSSSGISSRNRAVVNSNGAVTSIGDFVWPEDNESVHDDDQENHEEEEDMDAMDHDGEDEEEDELANLGVEIDVDAINSINEFGDDGLEADELAD